MPVTVDFHNQARRAGIEVRKQRLDLENRGLVLSIARARRGSPWGCLLWAGRAADASKSTRLACPHWRIFALCRAPALRWAAKDGTAKRWYFASAVFAPVIISRGAGNHGAFGAFVSRATPLLASAVLSLADAGCSGQPRTDGGAGAAAASSGAEGAASGGAGGASSSAGIGPVGGVGGSSSGTGPGSGGAPADGASGAGAGANGGSSAGAGANGGSGAGGGGSGGTGGQGTLRPDTFSNPVVPGFHPDPSIARVGDDYYLVNSSFEYFPGLPLFHSRDLVNWAPIGYALTRASQLALDGIESSQGIYAPTLRYHGGTFYLITTNVSGSGHFFVTAQDVAGPWSEPIFIDDPGGGIDPSLFFDDDGTVYYTRHGQGEQGGIFQAEINVATGELASAPIEIWSGTGGVWPEGPHLYKIAGVYYLMIAEGGTSYGHMETIARSESPWGPFEPYGENPILSHGDLAAQPIQATGHADLFEDQNGSWWVVFLGIRPWDGAHHHIGRETFLAPVVWNSEGWPVVNGGQPVPLELSAAELPSWQPVEPPAARDDFAASDLGLVWNFLRNPSAASWSLGERPGFLRLNGNAASLSDVASPAFVGRRQEHYRSRASTSLEFAPDADGQEAGLTVRMNEANHYDLFVTRAGGGRRVRLRTRVGGVDDSIADVAVADGAVTLTVEARPDEYEFSYLTEGGTPVSLGTAATAPLSSEEAGGFTGVYFAAYAFTGGSGSMPPADFDWFEYLPLDD